MSALPDDLTVDEAVARLASHQDVCRLCRDEVDETGIATGHVAAGHPDPRRTTHSQLGGLGADWDTEAVVEFLKRADRIVQVPSDHLMHRLGHRVAAKGRYDEKSEPRWYAFETRS